MIDFSECFGIVKCVRVEICYYTKQLFIIMLYSLLDRTSDLSNEQNICLLWSDAGCMHGSALLMKCFIDAVLL